MTYLRCSLLGLMMLLAGVVHAQNRASATDPSAKPDKAKLSYAIGYQIGSQFADGKPDVEIPVLVRAIQDAYAKRHPTVSMQDMHQQLQRLDQQMHADALAQFNHVAAVNARTERCLHGAQPAAARCGAIAIRHPVRGVEQSATASVRP